jgi:hypothetical protein
MAEEMDWSATNMPNDEGADLDNDNGNGNEDDNDDRRSFTLFKLHCWIFRSSSRKHH